MTLLFTLFCWGLWQYGYLPLWVAITCTVLVSVSLIYKAFIEEE